MTAVQPFDFAGQQVRVITIDGEPWFVAADVARVLGYSESSAMTRTLDDDEKGLRTVQTPGGEQSVTVVSEPGLSTGPRRRRGPAGPVVIRRLWHYARHGQPVPDFFTVTCPCGQTWHR